MSFAKFILIGILFTILNSCATTNPSSQNQTQSFSDQNRTATIHNSVAVQTSTTTSDGPASQAFSVEKCQTENPVKTYPREKQIWNDNLYKILKTLKVKETVNKFSGFNVSTIELYDILCVLNPPTDGKDETTTSCEYWTSSKFKKASTKVVINNENAEALRMFLYDFPVKQGDSGVSTPFIRCDKSDGMNVDCHIAITLNYEGP